MMKKKTWRGTRFKKSAHPKADKFLSSIAFDKKLIEYDIKGSIAHAKMLGKCGIIKQKEAKTLVKGLNAVLSKYKKGKLRIDPEMEDAHLVVAKKLTAEVGNVSKKLHTARSRNDQVVLDVKMYCKEKIGMIIGSIKKLQKALLQFSKKSDQVIIPAYTHMQQAQCVSLAHYILAYVEMLKRDRMRIEGSFKILDEMPLGSCALSGVSLPIDRKYVAKVLGFSKVSNNSIDAVSDRDFIIEILGNLAILGMHLSRLSEDLILWSTKEFDFIEIGEAFCTGSSIMPHKKNPDVLEYVRGYTGRLYGNLNSLLVTMKALPLSYNRDMQHDKEVLFSSVEIAEDMLQVLAELCKDIKANRTKIAQALEKDPGLYSVDIVEYLVKKGKSYKDAHDITGNILKHCYKKKITKITKVTLPLNRLKAFSNVFGNDIYNITFEPKKSVNLKTSYGGTAIKNVRSQIKNWEKALKNA